MSNPEIEPELDISEDEESESETSSVIDDQPKNPEDVEEFSDVEDEIEDDDDVEEEEEEDDDDEDIETTMKTTTQKTPIIIKPPIGLDDDEDDEDDDDEDDDDNYLQKFDKNIRHDIISEYHPELIHHNDEEVETLCKIVRDPDGNIIDPLHKTVPFITKYEKARILGERAKQINSGAKTFVKIEKTLIDGYLIALREYEEKMIPFIIRRPLPNGGSEYWKFADLEMID